MNSVISCFLFIYFTLLWWVLDKPISLKVQSSVKKILMYHYFSAIRSKMSPVVMDCIASHFALDPHPLENLFTLRVIYIQAGPVTNLVT